jgi:hypothetical protein
MKRMEVIARFNMGWIYLCELSVSVSKLCCMCVWLVYAHACVSSQCCMPLLCLLSSRCLAPIRRCATIDKPSWELAHVWVRLRGCLPFMHVYVSLPIFSSYGFGNATPAPESNYTNMWFLSMCELRLFLCMCGNLPQNNFTATFSFWWPAI